MKTNVYFESCAVVPVAGSRAITEAANTAVIW
jgi:hypothetical protein